ncbi:Mut7-C ubiquitin/RNAse domain-containing protein [Pyxidicoccus fallax]|uniref:Mut7-C ubiquitin/RNAse domain-containing protein n=1 Tax=Pyxidicoccus fallax TaxID=394095 RepID=A0A848LQU8_9BACT|nr:Mut7-C RNAse domain-containing protein [Pyxidicoccus fallax]NMO20049.1 Mut7-C ubiquitin/RNAse domain-containing protein [Pyxidicoccus fallax]NPC86318.1 Mut7-C ubiquitin/RNAse domain-containing protein [Pyxidicoccus fallax]
MDAKPGVTVRFYGALNDFLPPERRGQEFHHVTQGSPSVKDLIESLGPPHPEVDVVLVDGEAVDFAHRVRPGSRVAVYPPFHALDVTPVTRVGPPPQDAPRFVLDVGLGRLVGFLRMLGFDSLWRNDYADDELARVSHDEDRILLTRDLGVLKRGEVLRGYFPRSTDPAHQLVEVVRRFGLTARMHPFTRCLACNGPLSSAEPHEVQDRVPERVTERHSRFQQCADCRRVFWAGTHQQRMQALIDKLRDLERAE